MAALTFKHIQQRDGRWCILDLRGKHGRIRTAPVPTWVKAAIDGWTTAACVAGHVFRPVNRADLVAGERLGSLADARQQEVDPFQVAVDVVPLMIRNSLCLVLSTIAGEPHTAGERTRSTGCVDGAVR